ncbi:NUDIX hydrolase [Agromyces seonyuensis]|uniref:NUDIX domain-containing protein n=1 Tax=Agromyces seonyuensis TaxID=2662446 RepID=A0A6I4P0W1_9MICO|nr:NUDIX domain-containing protein [Agromyces seonyuensis]MWB97659.1 NUDIX domain-containing protein [Agromyces seonyuensis]
MVYRDSSDRTLEDYPRPSVAVDTAVLTVPDGGPLSVLLTQTNDALRDGADEWRLPGTFVHPGETLDVAVLRSLRAKAGITGLRPRQLRVFDAPDRDDRGWVLSVAHSDVVPTHRIALIERTRLTGVDEVTGLRYDHDAIVGAAVEALRADYRRSPDPAGLLAVPERRDDEPVGSFTIFELRRLHEAVLGERLSRDAFRRLMLPQLEPTGTLRRGVRGKPAELYCSAYAPPSR